MKREKTVFTAIAGRSWVLARSKSERENVFGGVKEDVVTTAALSNQAFQRTDIQMMLHDKEYWYNALATQAILPKLSEALGTRIQLTPTLDAKETLLQAYERNEIDSALIATHTATLDKCNQDLRKLYAAHLHPPIANADNCSPELLLPEGFPRNVTENTRTEAKLKWNSMKESEHHVCNFTECEDVIKTVSTIFNTQLLQVEAAAHSPTKAIGLFHSSDAHINKAMKWNHTSATAIAAHHHFKNHAECYVIDAIEGSQDPRECESNPSNDVCIYLFITLKLYLYNKLT